MISRKVKEHVFSLDDGKDIDYVSLEEQYANFTIELDAEKKEETIIEDINKKYELEEKPS